MSAQKKSTGVKRVSKHPKYVLKVKIEGPGVHKKSIPVPDLVKICSGIQSAVHRQAEAMEKPTAQTLRRGPITASVQKECTLELVGIVAGSTGLLFRYSKPQEHLPIPDAQNFGVDVLAKVAETVRNLGGARKPSLTDVDPGVLDSLSELGEVFDKPGITRISLNVPRHNGKQPSVKAVFTRTVIERIAERAKAPTHVRMTIEGRLEMADFKELGRLCRVHPPIGQSLLCSFEPQFEEQIYSALRRPVRLTGTANLNPNTGRPEELKIEEIEILDELLLGAKDFFEPRSLKQLAEAQGVRPLSNPKESAGGWPPDENVDEFVASTYQDRS
jgi:hypothetical protein